jgi:basic membrane protein A
MKAFGIIATLASVSVMIVAAGALGRVAQPSALRAAGTHACLVVTGSGVADRGFNQSAWEGVKAGAKANHLTPQYVLAAQASDFVPAITAYTKQPCKIIVTTSFLMTDATKTVAAQNPQQQFAITDVSYSPPLPNVRGLVFDTGQDSFLAGYLAAGMSKTKVLGTFGGVKIPPVSLYMDGFADGIAYYNTVHKQSVKLLGWSKEKQEGTFVGNFTDVAKGKQIAQAEMAQGADIIAGFGSNPDFGAAQAIQSEGKGKVLMIWPDTDGCVAVPKYCNIFLTSILKNIEVLVQKSVNDAAHGTLHGGNFIGTLKNHGVGLAPFHRFANKVPAGLKAELDALMKKIEAGTLVVKSPSTPK